jgi:hypothetical protein
VEIDGRTIGWTRDVSPTGVFMFLPTGFASGTGTAIRLRLRLDELDAARPAWISGSGQIVRLERVGGSTGLGVRVDEWTVAGPAVSNPT